MVHDERRERARRTVDIQASVGSGTVSAVGRITSLSSVGALVTTDLTLGVGTVVHLVVSEQEPAPTWEILGQVVRTEGTQPVALAIMFAPLPRETVNRIAALIKSA
jgi:hypothetical protein